MVGTTTLTIELFKTEMKTAEIRTVSRSRVDFPERASCMPVFEEFIGLLYLSNSLERATVRLSGADFRPELRRHLDYELAECLQSVGYPLVPDVSLFVEHLPGLRYRHGERGRNTAQGVDDVDHRVDRVDRRHVAPGRRDEPYDFILQV